MDTLRQQRATVGRYLASNAQVGKPLSSSEQKEWARRELKYRKEWEHNGVWRTDVMVDTDMIVDAWNYTVEESKRAAVRRAGADTIQKKDADERMKKREGHVKNLLEAYGAAIDMEKQKREVQSANLRPQSMSLNRVHFTTPTELLDPAPAIQDTSKGAGEEGMRAVPGGETDKNTLYPTLANDQPVLTNLSSPPPYMIHSHPPAETMHQHTMVTMGSPTDESRTTRDGPAVLHQHPLLTIRNGPVSIAYSGPMYKTAGENGTDDLRGSSRTPGRWTEMVIEGRSGPGAIMGREPLDPSRNSSRRHRDEEPCRTVRSTQRQGEIRQRYEEESWNRGDYREGEETQYEEMLSDTEDETYSNREAHTRARYQERRNDDRARNWPRDPDNLGYGMESGRRGREMEEAHQDDTRQDQQREPNNRQDLIPGQRSERQTWTQGESSLLMGCDTEEEPPRDDREDTFRENQVVGKSQTLRLNTRVKSLPPPLVTHHSMTTRPRRPDPWSPITSDHPQAMGCTPNPRNSSQFNTPNRDRSIDCSASQTRPCRPRQYTIEDFMAPLLTDGAGREMYTPWGHRDMHTLANSLPPLTAGAQAWVRKFEMETSGDNLALGDVRAIISRTYGPRRTNELERMAGTTNLADRTPLDPYRNHLWDCLRELFPGDMKKAGISNIHIKPEENIYQYIQRAEDLWVDRNDERPSDSRIGLQTFQEALIKGLTPAVQKTLKMVASLDYMKWDRWVEQLVHHYHLDQERRGEKW
ncbi:hypothetical protein N1851_027132 [Merluccius polli]|uniref:Uncharacterized protein n=1 Tax=Merluccius polli TaxID=89951 RepID=A0AA47NTE4_MERPO|nr:hypothetical protein N1851_027132 [Merluccius polli]